MLVGFAGLPASFRTLGDEDSTASYSCDAILIATELRQRIRLWNFELCHPGGSPPPGRYFTRRQGLSSWPASDGLYPVHGQLHGEFRTC
jgi:hypothetical protein